MLELLLSRTFAARSESSVCGIIAHGSENVTEISFPGDKISWNFRSRVQKSWNFLSRE